MTKPIKVKAHISITKPQGGNIGKYMSISVVDKESVRASVEITIGLEDLMDALTGLAHTKCDLMITNNDLFGKKRIMEEMIFKMPAHLVGQRLNTAINRANKLTKGTDWVIDEHFASQNSFFSEDGKLFARTVKYKWVDQG